MSKLSWNLRLALSTSGMFFQECGAELYKAIFHRQRPQPGRQSQSFTTPTRRMYYSLLIFSLSELVLATPAPAPSLTTEYTPRERGSTTKPPGSQSTPGPSQPSPMTPGPGSQPDQRPSDGVDPTTLPIATAPSSHPQIDPDTPGTFDGRSILEIDLTALADKGWRRPGSDISDWFNYGFDEISWESYCHRRRDMGELANVLKANVIVRTLLTRYIDIYWILNFESCISHPILNDKLTIIHSELRWYA